MPQNIKDDLYYYYVPGILVGGAGLVQGLLSFCGMYVYWPNLFAGSASGFLAVVYECEVYRQNINTALEKIFERDRYITKLFLDDVLQTLLDDPKNCEPGKCFGRHEFKGAIPKFFNDYAHAKENAKEDYASAAQLRGMQTWFLKVLQEAIIEREEIDQYNKTNNLTYDPNSSEFCQPAGYYVVLKRYLVNRPDLLCKYKEQKKKFDDADAAFTWTLLLAALSAVAMTFAMTFLLVETAAKLYLTWLLSPYLILALSMIAGAAYGLRIYNAVTDMIMNETLQFWLYGNKDPKDQGVTDDAKKIDRSLWGMMHRLCTLSMDSVDFFNILYGIGTVGLIALNLALTYFNAGTWWSVMTENPALFVIMTKLPGFIVTLVVPTILAVTELLFNFQNVTETIQQFQEGFKKEDAEDVEEEKTYWDFFWYFFASDINSDEPENLQAPAAANQDPYKIYWDTLAACTKSVFFCLHLLSVGLTSDRAPGVSEIIMTLVGCLSEGLEDWHYFKPGNLKKTKHNGHNHDDGNDLPSVIIDSILDVFKCSFYLALYAMQHLYAALGGEVTDYVDVHYPKFFKEKTLGSISKDWQTLESTVFAA
jgi:hypothetical protein